ncbi:helix-turn-helix domain-containing protein [Chitinophaga sp. LS1]|uniref:helix-turn-helix domain-containing protein n=1 Tax=Chitinophaga sp. LS1 TaxID=3051176 RepID=UPI002AAB10A8|nr:helix-turn-helix domain-containing protein [Chitinophaga sp. LS1]WPV65971.1 helix-turn-helix domain-containing protein [Chitinophaga sp. LS1]
MKEMIKKENEFNATPMLFPYEPDVFWQRVRLIIREEIRQAEKDTPVIPMYETPGMQYKPLYKITEVCQLFQVTKPTIYEWIKYGKLKPLKIRSRVFFLWQDIQNLLTEAA